MKRRYALYLAAAAPAVAAVTVVGTGVSQAEVSQVAPGPRIVAAAGPGTPAPTTAHPRSANAHRPKPVVQLTCHETDRPATGSAPAAATGASQASGNATTDSDTVTCHWSHLRRHLKVGSFELMRFTGGSGSPAPAAVGSFGAHARNYTDTSVAPGTSYAYVLHVLAPDGSQAGTSNTAKVKDDDDRAKPDCDEGTAPSNAATTSSGTGCPAATAASQEGSTQPVGRTDTSSGDQPENHATVSPQHPASSGTSPSVRHRGDNGTDARPNVSRSHRDPTEQAHHD